MNYKKLYKVWGKNVRIFNYIENVLRHTKRIMVLLIIEEGMRAINERYGRGDFSSPGNFSNIFA